MDKPNRVAKALMRGGWCSNAIMRTDGVPVLYVRAFNFEKLLLEAIDEGLSSLYGPSKQMIYSLLENTFSIKRQDIPSKTQEFVNAIDKIFGLGAKVLEILIIKRLKEKVGGIIEYPQELKELVFIEYVAAAQQSYLKKKNRFMHTHNTAV